MTNVLFVCVGNSCRSQMAEGFARKYGSDVMGVWSAGLAPAAIVQPLTIDVMREKNIDISDQFPKSVDELELDAFDVVVNMSGLGMPRTVAGESLVWNVADPMLQSTEVYVQVRDQIEGLVMKLILDLRRMSRQVPQAPVSRKVRSVAGPAPVRNALPAAVAVPKPPRPGDSSKQFGFGRVRRARD